jgi:hypothetical protein
MHCIIYERQQVMEMKLKTFVMLEKYFPITISGAWNSRLVGVERIILKLSASLFFFL